MEVWHLLDAAHRHACPTTMELLAQSQNRLPGVAQRVVLLGGTELRTVASSLGIQPDIQLSVPFGRGVLGYPSLRRQLRDLPTPDVVHCWSLGAAVVASLLPPGACRILSLTVPPDRQATRWLRAISRVPTSGWLFLTINATMRHDLICHGIDARCVHVLRPAVDMARLVHGERVSLRAGWGIGDHATVMALLTDPVVAGDANLATMVAHMADFTRQADRTTIHVLVHPGARRRRRAVMHMQAVGHGRRVICEPRLATPWRVLPGCDTALAVGGNAGGLSLLWSMAAGIPIVAEAHSAVGEIVEDRHSGLLSLPGAVNQLAHRVCQLIDDPQLAWKLHDTARHEAFSLFSRHHYCQSLHAIYRQIVGGEEIRVPEAAVTGGLRFMGRA